ncbi:RNA-binding transcriptional accessory protein [Prevotella intermedia]|jgi:tex-like protein N-terminal domain protein|uniref:RNA-binding transcriptional accessory protein n=1 Tax=Prevotella intermedia TaxID=28131 RepID=A0AAJ3RQZ5_PREIN|nr:Tex family protein [Prevotella intermedia]ATV55487.1 RNA-binding transcriptional accessory protein [Prevotella intermedia]PJI19547.1 RNA-binding transcriptional accessory protein [Prevotella intermedia]
MNAYTKHIAQTLNLSEKNVDATLTLLNDGCTIPFIARYRKERTGNLDEVQITRIAEMNDRLLETDKRKETILKTISEQGKLTEELENKIVNCWDNSVLEDLYLPFKPKRRTKAQIAREQGLEPLATLLLMQREQNPMAASKRFVKDDVQDEAAALQGAKDIIAETVSEDQQARNTVRNAYKREAMISSRVIKKVEDTDEAQKFSDYFDFFEPLRRCNSHRLLAMRRGEAAGILRVSISIDGEECIDRLNRQFVHGRGACQILVAEAVEDSFKRLINPSIENEFAGLSKERADEEAIKVFTENLRQLLLSAPLGQKRVLALDPGFANGCKIACLDAQGNLLHHEIIYPHPPKRLYAQATVAVLRMIRQYNIEAIAIGNGTASRESKEFITDCLSHLAEEGKETPKVFVVSEDGASIYSASLTAREEFPDEDVTTRGAVSIGRRLMDPLAELVKIDPKNIGVGQYQHDVDQAKLRHSLDQTVESCVNQVGVNLNTASKHLLMYVSGLGSALAQNIVDYRKEHGAFTSRAQLKKVPRLGAVAFQQCAGFLRIPNAKNPLDNSAVHPESYHIVEAMAEEQNCSVSELISNKELIKRIDLNRYISNEVGLLTLNDIMQELEKPGRDPREQLEEFEFDTSVHSIDDLKEGMELPGIVTNITNFGAFVDIGVHQDGLVHISQLSNKFVSDPNTVVHLHQHVRVRVTQIDYKRNRIGLSMKNVKQ